MWKESVVFFILTFLLCAAVLLGFVIGNSYGYDRATKQDMTNCKSPQHDGDQTRAYLNEEDGVLTLRCVYVSIQGNKPSTNIGERK